LSFSITSTSKSRFQSEEYPSTSSFEGQVLRIKANIP
jgi:hypothetical protein